MVNPLRELRQRADRAVTQRLAERGLTREDIRLKPVVVEVGGRRYVGGYKGVTPSQRAAGLRTPPRRKYVTYRTPRGEIKTIEYTGTTAKQAVAQSEQMARIERRIGKIKGVRTRGNEITYIGETGKKFTVPRRGGTTFTPQMIRTMRQREAIQKSLIDRIGRAKAKEPKVVQRVQVKRSGRRAKPTLNIREQRSVTAGREGLIKQIQNYEQKFASQLDLRRREAARIAREIDRKQQEGKKLTAGDRAALVSAGLYNVGIEALDAATFPYRRPKTFIVQALTGIGALVTRPTDVFNAVANQVKQNPAGFIASTIGTVGALNILGKGLRIAGKVGKAGVTGTAKITKATAKTIVKGGKKVVRATGKLGKNKVISDLAVENGRVVIRYQAKTPAGKIIRSGVKKSSSTIKSIAKRLTRKGRETSGKLSVQETQALANKLLNRVRNVVTYRKIIAGQKNVPKYFIKKINQLTKEANSLGRKIAKQKQAAFLKATPKKIIQLQKDLKAVEKRLASLAKKNIDRKLALKARQKLARKTARTAARRAKVKARRIQRRATGRAGVRKARKLMRKKIMRDTNIEAQALRAKQNLQKILKEMSKRRGQQKLPQSLKDYDRLVQAAQQYEFLRGVLRNQQSRIGRSLKNSLTRFLKDERGLLMLKKPRLLQRPSTQLLPPKVKSLFKRSGKSKFKMVQTSVRGAKSAGRTIKAALSKYRAIAKRGPPYRMLVAPVIASLVMASQAVSAATKAGTATGKKSGVVGGKGEQKPKQKTEQKQIQDQGQGQSVPKIRVDNQPQSRINTIINQILTTAAGITFLATPKGIIKKGIGVPGGYQRAKRRLLRYIKSKRFVYIPDLYSVLFGIRATGKERVRLLRKGRRFTGLEIRKIVR